MHGGLSALFERESAPVAQWIRAADFGLSRPMRCSPSVSGGAKASSYLLSLGCPITRIGPESEDDEGNESECLRPQIFYRDVIRA